MRLYRRATFLIYSHLFFCQAFFGFQVKFKHFPEDEKDCHKTCFICLFPAGVKEKNIFSKKYLTVENSTRQTFPAHRQKLEATMMDEFCQLLFHDFEVFI